jgi:DNA repair exonuclease SbcCD ATPase subunit
MNIIEKAEMHNFRGYSDHNNTIEFRPGVNLVLGDNATGKSTIVTLLLFNLLGKRVDVTRFEDYRTIEPKDLGNFRSRLTFSGIDDKKYSFEKVYSGKGQPRDRIYVDGVEQKRYGEWEFSRKDDVRKFMSDRFGAREEILEDIIIQTQDPLRLLWPVRDSKSVGKELAKLLRVEELQNIYTNAKSCENMLAGRLAEFGKEVSDIDAQINERGLLHPSKYQAIKKKLDSSKGRLGKRSKELEGLRQSRKASQKAIEKKVISLQAKSQYLGKVREQISSLQDELKGEAKPKSSEETLEKARDRAVKLQQSVQKRLDDVNGEIGDFKGSEREAKKQIQKFKPKLQTCSREYQAIASKLADLGVTQPPDTVKALKKLLRTNAKKKEQLDSASGGLKQALRTESAYKKILSAAKANCPVCDTELSVSARKKILAEKTGLIAQLRERMASNTEVTATTDSISQTLDLLEQNLKDSSTASDRIYEEEAKIKAAAKKLPSFEKKKGELTVRIGTLTSNIDAIGSSIALAEKFGQLRGSLDEEKRLAKTVAKLPVMQARLEKEGDAIEALDSKLQKVTNSISAIDPQIDSITDKIRDSTYWYGQLGDKRKAVKVAGGFAREVGLASEAAKLSLHESFTNYCNMISSSLAWIWPSLYDRPDLKRVELQTSIQEILEGDDRVISTEVQLMRVDSKGSRLPFNTISSHGQRVLASIAFRIAFLNLIAKSNVPKVLVLDEPTIWVDEKNRERLGQVLGGLVKEIKEGAIKIDQLIVVSHDSSFLNAIDPEAVKHQCIKNDEGFCEISTVI